MLTQRTEGRNWTRNPPSGGQYCKRIHSHVIDPRRFAYHPDVHYRPCGQEIGTAGQMRQVFAAYGVKHALLVQPNSGYGEDNRCMLSAVAESQGAYKAIAVVPLDVSIGRLVELQSAGVVGVAFNTTIHGVAHYLGTARLLAMLAELGMFLQLQCEAEQLVGLEPLIATSKVRLLIDHAGRPDPRAGLHSPAFRSLLELGRGGRAWVKLSGYAKFSHAAHPFEDCWPWLRALVEAFSLDRCLWASDWPYLRAEERCDFGPLLMLVAQLFPDAADRRRLFWETPCALLGFAPTTA